VPPACRRYNAMLARLNELAMRFADLTSNGGTLFKPAADCAGAYFVLQRPSELVDAHRQPALPALSIGRACGPAERFDLHEQRQADRSHDQLEQ
jgi:hypothetical protein